MPVGEVRRAAFESSGVAATISRIRERGGVLQHPCLLARALLSDGGGGGALLRSRRDLALLQYLICRGVGEQPRHSAEARALSLLQLQVHTDLYIYMYINMVSIAPRRGGCRCSSYRCCDSYMEQPQRPRDIFTYIDVDVLI